MPAPMLLAVDGDPDALGRVERELRDRYASSYRVVGTRSPDEALALLTELANAGEDVALVLAAQWLPETTGSELLERVRRLHPQAKRGLLVSWGEWGERQTAEAIFDSMALGRIDYYVLRPATSPDELFHQAISSFLLEWTEAHLIAPHTVRVVADAWAGRAYELRDTLQRCAVPHAFYLSDSEEGRVLLAKSGAGARLPLMVLPDGRVLSDPTNTEIADATGGWIDPDRDEFDVVIVGSGPAGLSAAVYGASEGLETLVVDEGGVGGQASSSSLIRNYLGFPRGVSGRRLAEQAYEQAWVFGGYFVHMHRVDSLTRDGDRRQVTLSEGRRISARAVILATGAAYRRLGVPALETLSGAGVFYGGPASEAPAMAGKDAYIVGGANSAGQAALHLARYARQVTLVVRAQSLGAGMSRLSGEGSGGDAERGSPRGLRGGRGWRRRETRVLGASRGRDRRRRDGHRRWALRADRGSPADRLAAGRDSERQARLPAHGPGSHGRPRLAARAPPVAARNEHAGRVRGGRCAAWIRQARGLCGRRRVDRDSARPQPLHGRPPASRAPRRRGSAGRERRRTRFSRGSAAGSGWQDR